MLVLYIILGIIASVLIIALFVSKELNYEKTVSINSSAENIWENVSSLGAMEKWSPWSERDPNMKRTLTGTDGEVGAKQSWVSDVKNVGEGSQTIMNLNKPNLLETKLEFIKPFKSTADAYVKLDGTGEETNVTWGFKSQMPYPMNVMKLFMNFEKNMDKDFGKGLTKLKNLCEG
jgi:hypothetical protein